ncbi:GxGYxYP domain-containing protein [Actinopolymorpha singaporensis]|uniref:GxGYxYP domain-containing protein n=1 Tax=Actinopolymorpha singaporensis TaxID=117157 RepID=UPI00156167F2|nr:GxGYxYP domain-containing protein [Actinopolymorpha singaporensis]
MSTFDLDGQDKGVRVALASLQGLVARRRPEIYLLQSWDDVRSNHGYLRWYMDKAWVKEEHRYDDPYRLIAAFRDAAHGLVVVDPEQEHTLNVATNVAGVENLLIVYPDQLPEVDLPVVCDLRGKFADAAGAYAWAYKRCWPRQSRAMLCCFHTSVAHDFQRDYAVQHRLHTFWLPGPDDPDHSPDLEAHVERLLHDAPANIPVLGFWSAVSDDGAPRGVGEYAGVRLAGTYAKYTWVSDWAGNYSFHAAAPVDATVFERQPARRKTFRPYRPDVTYVALIMIESGDAPGYLQYGLRFFQWDDPTRGKVPLSYGITPAARKLLPGILQWLYETATPNDYFFSSISGAGYCYPLEGYGSASPVDQDGRRVTEHEAVAEYFRATDERMSGLDMDMLGLYSHPWTPWTDADDTFVDDTIVPHMPKVTAVLADMGRNDGTTPANANRMAAGGVSVHHTLTRWPNQAWYPPYDTTNDEAAAQWLADQIRTNAAGGRFVQAMFYSCTTGLGDCDGSPTSSNQMATSSSQPTSSTTSGEQRTTRTDRVEAASCTRVEAGGTALHRGQLHGGPRCDSRAPRWCGRGRRRRPATRGLVVRHPRRAPGLWRPL